MDSHVKVEDEESWPVSAMCSFSLIHKHACFLILPSDIRCAHTAPLWIFILSKALLALLSPVWEVYKESMRMGEQPFHIAP